MWVNIGMQLATTKNSIMQGIVIAAFCKYISYVGKVKKPLHLQNVSV